MPELITNDLQFQYPGGTMLKFPDVHAEPEAPLAILGPSGCGKTTLLHLLAGLRKPQSGTIALHDTKLHGLSGRALDRFRGRNIGVIFQQEHFVRTLTVMDNLLAASYCAGLPSDRPRAQALAERLQIAHHLQRWPHTLSRGEQQRVSIARALMNQPALLLADEPTSSLDDAHADAVLQLLTEEARHHQAILVVVTHDARVKGHLPQSLTL